VASIFTRIIEGDLPGTFVWRDDDCVAILSINPLHPGHTLVIPRAEVDHWIDLDAALASHLFDVARLVGRAQQAALGAQRVALMVVGVEVPHTHLHVVPFDSASELNFALADPNPPEGSLDAAADAIREALRDLGAEHVSN
jgi:histidine triad (HIT) family protein